MRHNRSELEMVLTVKKTGERNKGRLKIEGLGNRKCRELDGKDCCREVGFMGSRCRVPCCLASLALK